MEVLPQLETVDLILTDPPYSGLKGGLDFQKLGKGVAPTYTASISMGDRWLADFGWMVQAWDKCESGMIIFCTHHCVAEVGNFMPGNRVALAVWFKRNTPPSICNVPHFQNEFIWYLKKKSGLQWRKIKTHFDIPNLTAGCISTGERLVDKSGKSLHPTQKPIALIKALLKVDPISVLDPFFGSGTTGAACEQLGIPWFGIESDEEFCELAAKRIEKDQAQLPMFEDFDAIGPIYEQASIF
jgi:DNA modification methylase